MLVKDTGTSTCGLAEQWTQIFFSFKNVLYIFLYIQSVDQSCEMGFV